MSKFKIGCDPEIFVGNSGGLKSIIGTIGGTKMIPRPLPIGEGYAVQEDNVALEFNIPAAESREEFIERVCTARDFLDTLMQDGFGLSLQKVSAASFPSEELQDPRALEFGCDPDFNVWTRKRNPRPAATDPNLRSCGGHVHVGYSFDNKEQSLSMIRAMDYHLGVPSVLIDKGELRKQLYGKRGAFRFKPYGVEYRVLSNFWVFDETLIGWVYDNTATALDAVLSGSSFIEYADVIQEAIDNNNKSVAEQFVIDHKVGLPMGYI